MSQIPDFATVDPFNGMSADNPGAVQNLVAGEWRDAPAYRDDILDPMNGELFLKVPDTTDHEAFIAGLESNRSGLRREMVGLRRLAVRTGCVQRDRAKMFSPEHHVRPQELERRLVAEN